MYDVLRVLELVRETQLVVVDSVYSHAWFVGNSHACSPPSFFFRVLCSFLRVDQWLHSFLIQAALLILQLTICYVRSSEY